MKLYAYDLKKEKRKYACKEKGAGSIEYMFVYNNNN